MNTSQLLLAFLLSIVAYNLPAATASCGANQILNVAILDGNLPYSEYDPVLEQPFGFDVDFILAIAQRLGYSVNFVFVTSQPTAGDLDAGLYDLYADSGTNLDLVTLTLYGAVVTDISQITNIAAPAEYRGYLFSEQCCAFMYLFQAAINELIANGTYANVVQKQRQDPRQIGHTFGLGHFYSNIFSDGALVEPLPFNSALGGTIPQIIGNPTGVTGCRADALVSLPILPNNCYIQAAQTLPICYTFTGTTDSGHFSGTGCIDLNA